MIPAAPNAGAIHHHRAAAAVTNNSGISTGASKPPPVGPSAAPLPTGEMRQRKSVRTTVAAATHRPDADSGAAVKRGLLVKKGHVLRTQKERLFVLQDAALRYYRVKKSAVAAVAGDEPDALQLKGVLQLEETDVITPTKGSEQWFRIRKLVGPDGKSYKLDLKGAETAALAEDWCGKP